MKIRDGDRTHKVALQEPRDTPPKSVPFVVFCIEWEEDKKFLFNTKKAVLKWVGIGRWNGSKYRIVTTSPGEHNGFIEVEELEENMRWARLPGSWEWQQTIINDNKF